MNVRACVGHGGMYEQTTPLLGVLPLKTMRSLLGNYVDVPVELIFSRASKYLFRYFTIFVDGKTTF